MSLAERICACGSRRSRPGSLLAKRPGELIAQFEVLCAELGEVSAGGVEQLAKRLGGGSLARWLAGLQGCATGVTLRSGAG
jgi:hypothetical protein